MLPPSVVHVPQPTLILTNFRATVSCLEKIKEDRIPEQVKQTSIKVSPKGSIKAGFMNTPCLHSYYLVSNNFQKILNKV